MFEYDCPLCGNEVNVRGASNVKGEDIFIFLCPEDGVFSIPSKLDHYLKFSATPEELAGFKSKVSALAFRYCYTKPLPEVIHFSSLD